MDRSTFLHNHLSMYLENREIVERPSFRRYSWVSSPAQQVWQERLNRIRFALFHMEVHAVSRGMMPVALLSFNGEELSRLSSLCLQNQVAFVLAHERGRQHFDGCAAVGSFRNLQNYETAVRNADIHSVADLLGYPDCCYQFIKHVTECYALDDLTLPSYYNSLQMDTADALNPEKYLLTSHSEINFFWRALGLSLTPMFPCSLNCCSAQAYAIKLLEIGREIGYHAEIAWLTEALRWSLSWTALHGTAELKLPIIKVIYSTDFSTEKVQIELPGSSFPDEGAYGINFPFKQAPRKALSETKAVQNAIVHLSQST